MRRAKKKMKTIIWVPGNFLELFWFAEVLCGSQEIIMGPKKSSWQEVICAGTRSYLFKQCHLQCASNLEDKGSTTQMSHFYLPIVVGSWPKITFKWKHRPSGCSSGGRRKMEEEFSTDSCIESTTLYYAVSSALHWARCWMILMTLWPTSLAGQSVLPVVMSRFLFDI